MSVPVADPPPRRGSASPPRPVADPPPRPGKPFGPGTLRPAPFRPPTRDQDVRRRGVAAGYDRSAPTHPAGSDPAKLNALLVLEPSRRGRHADASSLTGSWRWPRQ